MKLFGIPLRTLETVRACACLVLAITFGAVSFGHHKNPDGPLISLIIAGVCLVGTGVFVWQARCAEPGNEVTLVPNSLPRADQVLYYRRAWWCGVLSIPCLTAFVAYDLNRLETGVADRVRLVWPIGTIYEHFGYWPAVLILPAIGSACFVVISRKLQLLATEERPWISEAGRQ